MLLLKHTQLTVTSNALDYYTMHKYLVFIMWIFPVDFETEPNVRVAASSATLNKLWCCNCPLKAAKSIVFNAVFCIFSRWSCYTRLAYEHWREPAIRKHSARYLVLNSMTTKKQAAVFHISKYIWKRTTPMRCLEIARGTTQAQDAALQLTRK